MMQKTHGGSRAPWRGISHFFLTIVLTFGDLILFDEDHMTKGDRMYTSKAFGGCANELYGLVQIKGVRGVLVSPSFHLTLISFFLDDPIVYVLLMHIA